MIKINIIFSKQTMYYLAIGIASFALDFGLLYILGTILEVQIWLATGIAFLISFFASYFGQRLITFKSSARIATSIFKYSTLLVFNTVIESIVVGIGSQYFSWEIVKIFITIVITAWNFFAYKYFVYAEKTTLKNQKS